MDDEGREADDRTIRRTQHRVDDQGDYHSGIPEHSNDGCRRFGVRRQPSEGGRRDYPKQAADRNQAEDCRRTPSREGYERASGSDDGRDRCDHTV